MKLVENVHFERITFTPGKFTRVADGMWYTAYTENGETVVLRRTHPDADLEDVRTEGIQMARCAKAYRRRQIDRREPKAV